MRKKDGLTRASLDKTIWPCTLTKIKGFVYMELKG